MQVESTTSLIFYPPALNKKISIEDVPRPVFYEGLRSFFVSTIDVAKLSIFLLKNKKKNKKAVLVPIY